MRVLCCVSVVLTLAIGSVRAQRLPNRQQVAEDVDLAVRTELGKILSVVEYDRDIGKIARIHYYCAKAANRERDTSQARRRNRERRRNPRSGLPGGGKRRLVMATYEVTSVRLPTCNLSALRPGSDVASEPKFQM
jgi:hypothetical protein